MAKGTRPFRRTWVWGHKGAGYNGRVRYSTSAHARLDLAMANATSVHAWPSVVWHVDACPFRDPQKGKVR